MIFEEQQPGFLSNRPCWTLTRAVLRSAADRELKVVQEPFRFVDGAWQAETTVDGTGPPTRVVLRIAPDTLRRWAAAGINPFVEACAQLEEHLRPLARQGHLSVLTLL